MLSHPPPNRQSLASFDQVTRLPPKNASAPLGYPDVQWPDIPAPQVSPIRYMFACQKSQRSMPKAASSGVGFSAVAILGGGWLQSPASDGPPWLHKLQIHDMHHRFIFQPNVWFEYGFINPMYLSLISCCFTEHVTISHKWQMCSSLQWRYNGRDGVSNHQRLDCLLNRLFSRRSKKTSKFRVTGHLSGEFTGDRWIPRTNGQ